MIQRLELDPNYRAKLSGLKLRFDRITYKIIFVAKNVPRFSGGHLTCAISYRDYSEKVPLAPIQGSYWGSKGRQISASIVLRSHSYYHIDQYFFEGGWDWGMHGYLEGYSKELTPKGRYE